MKLYLIFNVFFICGFCQDLSDSVNGTTDVSNRERPCEIFHTDCIRKYFARNSNCKIAHGPVPDPLYFDQTMVFLPAVNVTITLDNLYRKGLNGRIVEFYINKETDRLVFSVEFRNLVIASNTSYYFYYRRAKEPIINKDYYRVEVRSLTVTLIIPNIKDLQPQFGEVYVYYNSPEAIFQFGPNAFKGSDPGLQQAMAELYLGGQTILKEGVLVDGAYDIISFIQYNICDFGL